MMKPLLTAGAIALILVGSGLGWQAMQGNDDAAPPVLASLDRPPPAKWIVDGPVPLAAGPAGAAVDVIHQIPREVKDGPKSLDAVVALVALLPKGTKFTSRVDYPDLAATRLSYVLANGDLASIDIAKRTRPVPLSAITAGSSADRLMQTTAGTQYVMVRRNLPGSLQLFLVRPSGVAVSFGLHTAEPGGKLATVTDDGGTYFAELVRHLDIPALDTLF